MLLGILGWIVVGLLVGFVASRLVNLHGDDPRAGVFVAVCGAIVAAVVYTLISGQGVSGWNVWSLVCAAAGGVAGAVIWHAVRSRYVSRDRYVPRSSY